jgi:hypothetical protein
MDRDSRGGWQMDLVELEKIRRLKYRYLRCVDLKLWDEIGDLFTDDATADYGTPSAGRPLNVKSRDEPSRVRPAAVERLPLTGTRSLTSA